MFRMLIYLFLHECGHVLIRMCHSSINAEAHHKGKKDVMSLDNQYNRVHLIRSILRKNVDVFSRSSYFIYVSIFFGIRNRANQHQ